MKTGSCFCANQTSDEIDRLVGEFKAYLHRTVIAYMARSKGFACADGENEHTYLFAMFRAVRGRPNSPRKLNHEFLNLPVLRDVLAADGIPVPRGDVSKYISNLRSLPLNRQRRFVEQFLGPDLDTMVSRLTWQGRTRLAEVRTINHARVEATDAIDFLHRIAGFALRYIASSNRMRGIRREGRRGDSDSYDIATVLLLLAWFRRHGILLFPAQHLDTRLFGVFSLSWSAATRVAEVMPLYLNDAEAQIYQYLCNELETVSAFEQAKPGGKKKSGGRPRKSTVRGSMDDGTPELRTEKIQVSVDDTRTPSNSGTEDRVRPAYAIRLTSMRSHLVNVFMKSNMVKIGPNLRAP